MDCHQLGRCIGHDASVAVTPLRGRPPQPRPGERAFSFYGQPRLGHSAGFTNGLGEAATWDQAPLFRYLCPAPPEGRQFVKPCVVHWSGFGAALQLYREAPCHVFDDQPPSPPDYDIRGIPRVNSGRSGIEGARRRGVEVFDDLLERWAVVAVAHERDRITISVRVISYRSDNKQLLDS